MCVSGVILAGGKSSRMGVDKGLVSYNGKLLVSYAIDLLKPFCDELIISANSNEYDRFDLKVVADSYDCKGPLAGIYEGLKAIRNDYALVLSCDMPHLSQEAVQTLFQEIDNKHDCFIPFVKGRMQPLFAIYAKCMVPVMKQHLESNKLKMMTFVDSVCAKHISFDTLIEINPLLFKNCNRPEDVI